VRVHGVFKPDGVTLGGRRLVEIAPDHGDDGWWWDEAGRTVGVRLEEPLAANRVVTLRLENAGTFADRIEWQKAWNLRTQLRQMKRDMKLKHAALVSGPGIKKPPRVIREAEQIEQMLSAVVDQPKGCAKKPLDFAALEKRLLTALTDDPFESNRTLPEVDPESRQGMELTKGAKFAPEEIQRMTSRLRGAELPAWLWSGQ
jgi:hypothetical protein